MFSTLDYLHTKTCEQAHVNFMIIPVKTDNTFVNAGIINKQQINK